jgi:chromosome partitioning protein
MKVIAVVQNKGGVGKTTLAKLLAEYFPRVGRRVLAIDLDPQCNFSGRFIEMAFDPLDPDGKLPPIHPDFSLEQDDDWSGRSSSASIYNGQDLVPYPTNYDNLSILPGHGLQLRRIERVKIEEVQRKVSETLKAFVEMPAVQEVYDLIVIDTGPDKGPLTVSAARAASHLLIPTIMEPQPLEGLDSMLQLWRNENRIRTDGALQIIGIVPNMMRKRLSIHEGLLESLRGDPALAPFITPFELHDYKDFKESDYRGFQPPSVLDLPDDNKAKKDAMRLCAYVEEKVFGNE